MRALAASDLHGNHAAYEWLGQTARRNSADLVVLAGDLLGFADGYDSPDAAAIVRILEDIQAPIYFIMGNDDLVELNPESDRLQFLQNRRVEIGRFNIVGYQYSLPFMGGIFEKPEGEIRADLSRLRAAVDDRTILVTHSPAYGILDLGIMDIHAGSQSILDLVREKNVRAHIHGHIHGSFGRLDCHFNVAAGGACRAMLIDLDTLEATVERE